MGYELFSSYQGGNVPASMVVLDTTNFNGNLSGSDNTVQKALDTLDNLSLSLAVGATITGGGSGRVLYQNTLGKLAESTSLVFDGTSLTAAQLKASNLVTARLALVGAGGLITSSPAVTYIESTEESITLTSTDAAMYLVAQGSKGGGGVASLNLSSINYACNVQLDDDAATLSVNGPLGSYMIFDGSGGFNLQDVAGSYILSDGGGNVYLQCSIGSSLSFDSSGGVVLSGTTCSIILNDASSLTNLSATSVEFNGKLTKYLSINTVRSGHAVNRASSDSASLSAAVAATTIYPVPATNGAGLYRVSFTAKIITAATVSSVLGGTGGFQVKYTDLDDSVVVTTSAVVNDAATSLSLNTTQAIYSGSVVVNCKASTNLQYLFDYTSAGGTPMAYKLHITVEQL